MTPQTVVPVLPVVTVKPTTTVTTLKQGLTVGLKVRSAGTVAPYLSAAACSARRPGSSSAPARSA